MVKQCRSELEDRLFAGIAHAETSITAQEVKHDGERVSVRLEVASGEGRSLAGTCVFRDAKLFDVE